MEYKIDRFDRQWAMQPFWEGNTVYNESVVFVKDKQGKMEAPLFYTPDKIISVRDYSLSLEYELGRDYIIDGNKIVATENTRMSYFEYDEFFVPGQYGENIMNYDKGGNLRVAGGGFFHPKDIHITYTHSDEYPFKKPEFKGKYIPRLIKKFAAPSVITAVFYGDSITSGDECSDYLNLPPYQPEWLINTCQWLCVKYGCFIHRIDTAIGGTDLEWGIENCESRVANLKPDVAFIGFGNNDRCSVEEYLDKLRVIINKVRAISPETDFVIIDPMRPNRFISRTTDGYRWDVLQGDYAKAHLCLQDEFEGVMVLEMMQLHLDFQERKRFWDINNNNINHPNDFFYRILAQNAAVQLIEPHRL